ncbi:glycoside hydrolase [Nocardia sp. NBC_00565]|uniref:glycoside hydrolase n=1 Tax=Nocardia sp. NBC_00565 TaxID=2975993 RepID=UPI002E80ACFB|nr:glycoside hydrolase [Nocardia sp. NBC_00565]WUC03242.1 glycoside hydrolase [Nocardia sp. NBC_00565]
MTTPKMCRRSLLVLSANLPLSLGWASRNAAAAPSSSAVRYTMTGFTNGSETDLYVYESTDATKFRLLRGPAYRPPSGIMRDPSIFRNVDDDYYLTYTASGDGHTIGFARSTDRVTWTYLYDYTIPMLGVEACWAPEWFVDVYGRVNVIVSMSNGLRFTPFLMTATDVSLRSWGAPARMAGLAPNPLDTTAIGYIDTTVVVVDGRYFAFTKNETTKYIELAVADNPLGPYVFVGIGDWAGWGAPREGQSLIQLPDGGWRIFFDAYTEGKYFYSDSRDTFRTWTTPRELPGLSGTLRHATIFSEHDPQSAP